MTMTQVLEEGWVAPDVAENLPGLRIVSRVSAAPHSLTDSDEGVTYRLGILAGRLHGGRAVELRREEIPAAYRVAFRHLGLDPDVRHTPIEDAVIGRLVRGGYSSRGRLDDALLLALIETSVPVLAFDADLLSGGLGLRVARRGEQLGRGPRALPASGGKVAVCDEVGPVAELFSEPADSVAPAATTTRLRLAATAVAGVSDAALDEALWICEEALDSLAAE